MHSNLFLHRQYVSQQTDSKSHCQFPVKLLCYLLSQAPVPLKPMITTNQSFIPSFPPTLLVLPATFISSFSMGASTVGLCFPLVYTQSSKIPYTYSARFFLHVGETPRQGTARKSLDLHCRKSVLAPVWNMLSTEKISWAFRW